MTEDTMRDIVQENQFVLTGESRSEIEAKIDAFLAKRKPFKALKLVLPAAPGATRFEYRGMHVRVWLFSNFERTHRVRRFDTAIELLG